MEGKLDDERVKIDVSTFDKKIYPGKEMDDDESESSLVSRKKERDSLKIYACSCYDVWIFHQSHEVILMSQDLHFHFWVLGHSERYGGGGLKHNSLNFKVKFSNLFATPQTTVFFFPLYV